MAFYYFLFSVGLGIAYASIMLYYWKYWKQLAVFQPTQIKPPLPKVTVIVPARNEAANIKACLESILNQTYPSAYYELIVIDDHSEDETNNIIQSIASPQLRLFQLKDFLPPDSPINAYKKKAIEIGIQYATGELILCTDADCIVPPQWISLIANCYLQHNAVLIAAPVHFAPANGILSQFQALDFIGMMGITGAGIQGQFQHMCNGANLAYTKAAFKEVNGFEGIDHLASGDDMLLIQKMAKTFPNRITFLKHPHAAVSTPPQPTLNDFIQQRKRWATKSGHYKEWKIIAILAMVFFCCINIVLSIFLIPFFGMWGWGALMVPLGIKLTIDYFFLSKLCQFFQRDGLMRSFWTSQLLHVLYIVGIGIWSNVSKQYQWKGRVTQ